MSTIGAVHAGLIGMRTNLERFERSAVRIADRPVSDELPEHLVEMLVSQRGFEANARVVKAADEMVGTLLDVLA